MRWNWRDEIFTRLQVGFNVGWIVRAGYADHELSSGSRASSRRFSPDMARGRRDATPRGACPPLAAQLCRYHVSHLRMFNFATVKLANRENSAAASRPLHNAPEP